MEFSNTGLDPDPCFDSQAWLMEGRRVGVFKEKNFIVLNDLLGHFKQF